MEYKKLFKDLIDAPVWKGKYIGQGNPNSDILIIGREHGFAKNDQRMLEIDKNWQQWNMILAGGDPSETGYSPRHCYLGRGQEFRIGDTSATWYVYQEIINTLRPHIMADGKKGKILDFFDYSFITEFSAVNRPNNSNNTDAEMQATADSIAERTPLLSSAFYRSFPIVILSCGRYFDKYHINIEEMFDVKWIGETIFVELNNGKRMWLNVHYSSDRKRVVIHTWQASALKRGSDATFRPFFDKLKELCAD